MRKERGLERLELAVSGKISQNEAKESPPALRTSFYFYVRTSSNCTCDQEFLDSPSPAQMEAASLQNNAAFLGIFYPLHRQHDPNNGPFWKSGG